MHLLQEKGPKTVVLTSSSYQGDSELTLLAISEDSRYCFDLRIKFTTFCSIGGDREVSFASVIEKDVFNPLIAKSTKWSNTLKQFVGCYRRIV